MNNDGEDKEQQAGQQDRNPPVDDVKIQRSETGSDPEVGHTPGKAEGVDEPETQGNE
ncbi:MAG TPA: hypothetical protein VL501_05140 [Pyrinomonadaceae bacterium]|nr:hypothetical protein [Pyrinomonadaceae bacterium]